MDRSKRAIRTPKRFDDEAFEPSPKQQLPTKPKPIEIAKPSPVEPVTPKNIIKVKLTKAKRVDDEALEPSPKQQLPTKPKPIETAKPSPVEPATPKNIIKVKLTKAKPRELVRPTKQEQQAKAVEAAPKETPRPKEPIKPKEPAPKLKEPSKTKESARWSSRPKTKRPRTPPVYADLMPNVVLPFWDARTAAEDHEDDNVKELVHCHCGIAEELGLMVQCETCLTWQHAHCLGIERPEDAPDGYTCRACSDPKFARDSMKWAYDQDWLTKGRMKQFPCDPNPIPEKRVDTLRQINDLISHALQVHQLIHSLGVKTRLLMNAGDEDPELKLFRHQWPASYQHRDGTHFIPTINHPSSTPASTISAIGDTETPDSGDITAEQVTDVTLPDIGHLDDVTAILENSYVEPSNTPTIQPMAASNEITPNDCRTNLRLHIQQTEEFISIELAQIEEKLTVLERECGKGSNLETSLDSLKNDLQTMKKYIALKKYCEN